MTMMQLETTRPALLLDPVPGHEDVVEFTAGLPGFPGARRFRIEDLGPDLAPFCRIRSVDEPTIAFTVVPPGALFPDYSVEIDEERVAQLHLDSSEDVITLVIVTTQAAPCPPTANLLGPIVINRTNHAAAQVVQHRSSYGVAEPIPLPA
jgi:flagellar assembly factor FliW